MIIPRSIPAVIIILHKYIWYQYWYYNDVNISVHCINNALENGIIHFFIKNNKIVGACGLGLMGKVGRDIRISSKLIEKNTIVDKKILLDQNAKLNKLIKNQ